MSHTRAWRNFRRLEDGVAVFAGLALAGAGIRVWETSPLAQSFKLIAVVAAPVLFVALAILVPISVPAVRKALTGYVWKSFTSGFGQSARSVLSGFLLPAAAAGLMLAQIHNAQHGGPFPASILAAYGAGVGILVAQAILVRALERDPVIRAQIET